MTKPTPEAEALVHKLRDRLPDAKIEVSQHDDDDFWVYVLLADDHVVLKRDKGKYGVSLNSAFFPGSDETFIDEDDAVGAVMRLAQASG